MLPRENSDGVISKQLTFPLASAPLNQTSVKLKRDRSSKVKATLQPFTNGKKVVFSGPVVTGARVLIPESLGLKAGTIIHNKNIASEILQYDAEQLMALVDVPGEYQVTQRKE
jgi:hypothetical protein